MDSNLPSADELVVNWHVLEPCNFSCRFCYAKWEGLSRDNEVWRRPEIAGQLLQALRLSLDPSTPGGPLADLLTYSRLRLNFAGGEPMVLGKHLDRLVLQARNLGFRVSLITNGSLGLPNVPLDMIGISVDAADIEANELIGRHDKKGSGLDMAKLADALRGARRLNPALQVKLNTVVSAWNHAEDLTAVLDLVQPDRWKIFRMLPSVTDEGQVTGSQFGSFVNRHQAFRHLMAVEDNEDMTESYLMIDPAGRFFQNRTGGRGYAYSDPIVDVGVARALAQSGFHAAKFARRYVAGTGVVPPFIAPSARKGVLAQDFGFRAGRWSRRGAGIAKHRHRPAFPRVNRTLLQGKQFFPNHVPDFSTQLAAQSADDTTHERRQHVEAQQGRRK